MNNLRDLPGARLLDLIQTGGSATVFPNPFGPYGHLFRAFPGDVDGAVQYALRLWREHNWPLRVRVIGSGPVITLPARRRGTPALNAEAELNQATRRAIAALLQGEDYPGFAA